MFTEALWQLVSTILGFLALFLGWQLARWINQAATKEGILRTIFEFALKKQIAETAVRFVEQVYKELNGPQKLEQALEWARVQLKAYNIDVTDDELRALIEKAVLEFKKGYQAGAETPPDPQ